MNKITLLLFLQIYITIIPSVLSSCKCLNKNNEFFCKLGTRTPYRFIANNDDSRFNYPGCIEKKIWLMIRHGTRLPGKRQINSMINNFPELQKKIINKFKTSNPIFFSNLIKQFLKWKLSFDDTQAMHLANEGENELIDLAERMQTRFPTLFLEDYNKNLFKFKYTATQRTEKSAESFALGLFGQHNSLNISFPEPEHKDPILRFYKNCERWLIRKKKSSETCKEKNLFLQSTIFQKTLSEISERIGHNVNYETTKLIYMICGFEIAWNTEEKSPWCNLLTYENIKVLEFIEDLESYWTDGYGFCLNYEQACPVLVDMFEFFENFFLMNFFRSNEKTLVSAYFTHSGAILKVLSILGIAKDKNVLTHTSFSLHKDFRHWRLSLIDAFASNIAFVLYDCEQQGPSILVLHQERPVYIPGCPVKSLCPISLMKKILPGTKQKCQFDTMCSIEAN